MKIAKRTIAILLSFAIAANIAGCGAAGNSTANPKNVKIAAVDLMSGIEQNPVLIDYDSTDDNEAAIDFAVRLFKQCASATENTSISPSSVLCALAMTANGADGNTLAQIEDVFGVSVAELNAYFHTYMHNMPTDEKCKLSFVNSIWFKDDETFAAEEDFLQINADYYGASIYKAAFDDRTLKDINNWVQAKTDGMITDILDRIPELAVMYLINALAFDAEWQDIYKDNQIRDGIFTSQSGKAQNVKMMYCEERSYLDDGKATGFIKKYSGGQYAFVALLPNEGISVHEYIATLTGQNLANTVLNAQSFKVNTVIPKFESEYSTEMGGILKGMGMTDAFDSEHANFTRLGHSQIGNLYISRVLHKTYISVNERGTKAGASTVVEIMPSSSPRPEEIKTVYLDRPFVYMLINLETGLPFFIGAVMEI